MAYGKKPVAGFRECMSLIEKDISGLVFVRSDEPYLFDWIVDRIKKKHVDPDMLDFDYTVYDGSVAASDIEMSTGTFPMGSKKKLIVIKEAFKEAGKSLAVKSEIEKLTEIATNLEGEVILLIGSKKLGGAVVSAPIRKLKAVGEFFDIGRLSLSQANSFVRKRVEECGKTISYQAAEFLISELKYGARDSGEDLYSVANEAIKLAYSTDKAEITKDDISKVTSKSLENNVFLLLDAIGYGKKDKALCLLRDLMIPSKNEFSLLGFIISQLEMLLAIRECTALGKGESSMIKVLPYNSYRIKKSIPVAGRYSIRSLVDLLRNAYSADEKIKTGLMPADLVLEMFVATG